MNGVPSLQRQSSDYYMNAMSGGMAAVPAHMRPELHSTSRPQSPAQYQMPVNGQQQRPSLTSQPSSSYNPPQILEPPTNNGQQQGGSGSNSPHMSNNLGWQSPHHAMGANQQNEYAYPEPHSQYNAQAMQMYYQQQQQQQQVLQRPHSTGPLDYNNQIRPQEVWAPQHHQQ